MNCGNLPDCAPACSYQEHNTKNNSYLTKFVLSILPNDLYKETNGLDLLLQKTCDDFKDLFETGLEIEGQRWFVALTGLKGDLKWYEKIANLKRCFNKQIGSGLQMCHECEAGSPNMPFEDAGHFPCWRNHLFQNRPWDVAPTVTRIPFEPLDESGQPERVLRRDLFHNSKVGLLRDFVGSSVLLLIFLGYFRDQGPGVSNRRDVCLERAHRHFYLFCISTGGKPGLRSFTPVFFNAKKQTDFGWVNAKGSDVTLLVKWLAVLAKALMNDPLTQGHLPTLKSMYLGAVCVRTWQRTLYSHGLWLPRHCAMCVYQELHEFLQHYNCLAFRCINDHSFIGYAMKSKFHMLAHTKQEIAVLLDDPSVEFIPSPLIFSGEMNEDVIGKIARLSRRVDSRLQMKRTLQLYLCKAKAGVAAESAVGALRKNAKQPVAPVFEQTLDDELLGALPPTVSPARPGEPLVPLSSVAPAHLRERTAQPASPQSPPESPIDAPRFGYPTNWQTPQRLYSGPGRTLLRPMMQEVQPAQPRHQEEQPVTGHDVSFGIGTPGEYGDRPGRTWL
eukprot:s166_g27.t1